MPWPSVPQRRPADPSHDHSCSASDAARTSGRQVHRLVLERPGRSRRRTVARPELVSHGDQSRCRRALQPGTTYGRVLRWQAWPSRESIRPFVPLWYRSSVCFLWPFGGCRGCSAGAESRRSGTVRLQRQPRAVVGLAASSGTGSRSCLTTRSAYAGIRVLLAVLRWAAQRMRPGGAPGPGRRSIAGGHSICAARTGRTPPGDRAEARRCCRARRRAGTCVDDEQCRVRPRSTHDPGHARALGGRRTAEPGEPRKCFDHEPADGGGEPGHLGLAGRAPLGRPVRADVHER